MFSSFNYYLNNFIHCLKGMEKRHKQIRKIVLGIYILSFIPLSAQFDPGTSQYMLNPTGYNPAAVGLEEMVHVVGQHRLNLVGMPNGGSTTFFNIHMPLKFAPIFQGVGIRFMNDKAGQFINQGAGIQLSLKKKIGNGYLSIGTDFGFTSIGFNGDSVALHMPPIGEYHDLTADPEIPTTAVAGISSDLNVGLWYRNPTFYAGFSATHINQPTVRWGEKTEFSPSTTAFLTLGYNYKLDIPKWELKPSLMLKSEFSTWQLDLSTLAVYNKQYWGGISLRTGEALVLLGGIQIASGLSIGYSYDIPTTTLINASMGSHEVFLSYSFELDGKNENAKFKSIRIL